MKLKLIIATFLSMFLFSAAQAGSFGMGVTGGLGMIGANGSETNSESGSETEKGQNNSASVSNDIGFSELYAEYSFGDSERLTLGVAIVPGSHDISSKTMGRTDIDGADAAENDNGSLKVNGEISDHTTYYAEVLLGGGVYVKAGLSKVDITVNQTNDSGYGTYPNKELDAITYALGYKGEMGERGVYKIEGFTTDYDTYSASSTTTNSVSADLDVRGAKLSLGFKF